MKSIRRDLVLWLAGTLVLGIAAVALATGSEGALLLFGHAEPIGEPVVAHGPFVMNSEAEIRQAIADYQAGRFEGAGKLPEVGR